MIGADSPDVASHDRARTELLEALEHWQGQAIMWSEIAVVFARDDARLRRQVRCFKLAAFGFAMLLAGRWLWS